MKPAILREPIEALKLSPRAYNRLKHDAKFCYVPMQFDTIGDLVDKREVDLLKIKNLGRKTLYEIRNKLALHGLCLRMMIRS
jgi:DNA-directed RNA polymerase subunit alpha